MRPSRVWLGVAGLGALVLWGASAIVCEPEAKPGLRVLFPADQCVVESSKVELLCVAPAAGANGRSEVPLRVDGKPGKWGAVERPVLHARLELSPGMHELAVAEKRLRVFVADEKAKDKPPEDWPVLKNHSTGTDAWKDCSLCHELEKRDGPTTIRELKDPLPCLQCHSADEFASTHFHVLKPIEACQMCHAIHGSTREGLLKAPAKKLCAECHD